MTVYVVWEHGASRASLASLTREAARHMFGTTCHARSHLERECFTAQRCASHGRAWRSDPDFAHSEIAIVAADSRGAYKGSLQAKWAGTAWFVFNVCVAARWRGSGVCEELFAHFAQLSGGAPVELTVFLARAGSAAETVVHARGPRVMRLYARLGFVAVGTEGGTFVRMRSEQLRVGAPRDRRMQLVR